MIAKGIVCLWGVFMVWRMGSMIGHYRNCEEGDSRNLMLHGIGAIGWFSFWAFIAGYAMFAAVH